MRFIPTKTHGYLDYVTGIFLVVAPWLFGFAAGGPETWIMVMLGMGAIVYSLFTNYELGFSGVISMRNHLLIDFLHGAVLTLSPWIFGFADYVYAPHLVLGIFEMLVVLSSKVHPQYGPGQHHHSAAH